MAITFRCGCGRHFEVADALAGKRAKCHRCGASMTVPLPEAATVASVDDMAFGLLTSDEPRPGVLQNSARDAAPRPQRKARATSPTAKLFEEDEPQGPSDSLRVVQLFAGIAMILAAVVIGLIALTEIRESFLVFAARLLRSVFMVIFGMVLILKASGESSDTENRSE
jgi:hypothetical protein